MERAGDRAGSRRQAPRTQRLPVHPILTDFQDTGTQKATESAVAWAPAQQRTAKERCAASGAREPLRRLLVLPVLDEVVDHAGIGQGRGVAQAARLVLGDLAQDAAHDLAGARFWQTRCELNLVGRSDWADLLAYPGDELLAQILGWLDAGHQGHIGVDALALDVVREANHGGLRNLLVRHQRAFDFGGTHAVAGDVDDVVDAPGDPVITVGIAPAAVAGEVLALVGREISLLEAGVVAIDRAHLARP